MESGDPLVTAEWLKENINAPDLRMVDASWVPPFLSGRKTGLEGYTQAHIPGAVFFNIDTISDQASDLPHMLPDATLFSSRVRKLGLGDGHRLVIYDHNGFFASARAWWMFRVMGHSDIKVLDGGLAAWQAAGGEIEDLAPTPIERHYTARKRTDLVRDMRQMHDNIAAQTAKVLDARAPGRFDGSAPEPRADLRSGHIPDSFCVPASSLLNEDATMKSVDDLQELLEPYVSGPVTATCGSGVSAAIIALALARLGNWDTAIYDGSWSEWAANCDNPIATS